ncbi:hypothetical protein IFM89_035761 [Coptis chinensis]|uniref:DNA-directed DNA polymerase n=2 Tax=Magnoliopsida TaxID=3398 RepID=A0A835HDQ1_9MAGN|nr:hypothetical protein IFM89_035761 [Coptis chinensis]
MMNKNWRDQKRDYRNPKKQKLFRTAEEEREAKFGFDIFSQGDKRLGWLLTFSSSSWEDQDTRRVYSCVDLYFVTQDGSNFKCKYRFKPYFYAATKDGTEMGVETYLKRRYEGQIADIELTRKEDLNLKNHLSGLQKSYLKISFDTVQQLMLVRNDLLPVVQRNQEKIDTAEAYESILTGKSNQRHQDFIECIVDLREYDVPFHVRFAIDNGDFIATFTSVMSFYLRCGQWYDVSVSSTGVILEKRTDLLQRAEVHVCAFDIETTKLPLKFPDAEIDSIMMISYMVDGQGYLIINRECVWEDIEDLEYTPKPEFEGYFKVKNVKNEEELLRHWFAHMREVKPGIYVTYNGDFFDWPFLETRAAHHGMVMNDGTIQFQMLVGDMEFVSCVDPLLVYVYPVPSHEVGFHCDQNQNECRAKFACHLDCFAWVKRDSYLPQGSQGLKAVTKTKLGYDPLEVNPEDMVRFAKEQPQTMASYSVSDAVSTYYLYMTYVHPFIFSLATIIPMPPDEVLRKGSGTLCEMLLMVQAYKANVICPNKYQADLEKFHNSHLLESETYIGGHVECLESGVFRSDLPTKFQLDRSAYEQLINNLDRDLQYAIKVEGKMDVESVSNYDDVKNAIMEKLISLRDEPVREECPLIYHLDVAAMYPNIILTNRLQPPSIVSDEVCTACDFNRPGKTCLRKLEWVWRGEMFMAKKSDYYHLKRQIESELVDRVDGQWSKSFLDLPKTEQQTKLKDRLRKYCQKAYKRVLDKPVTELREAGICMRENPFYVDTVRRCSQVTEDMVVVYDSLQLAHKCILNSFYGYVMRKGARWYSMEMAGVVTYTGAKIIQNARLLVEKIGRPLELDTDGIWCALPGSFPENFTFKTIDLKRKLTISYPCVMLNVDVARNNTNDQYQTLSDPVSKTYTTHSECSIEFEVDGPYKAMILPASKEEGILIKKRYAVFNDDGTLAELKGFEIKRRGELKLIKVFQAEVFDKFLHGKTLEECYSAVASVANRWLDLLDNQGIDVADSELLDYISESSTMSKSLADYGEQKSCAVTTARRLADFLGSAMVKDKGLRCQYIVACEPQGTPVSERAIPVAIFESAEMKTFLRKWCKISADMGIRSIIDWSYYKQRLSSTIQKIITIPAAMQKVANPVPRVIHPEWLHKKVREKDDKFRQRKLVDMFSPLKKGVVEDLEDFRSKDGVSIVGPRPIVRSYEMSKERPSAKASCRMVPPQQQTDANNRLHQPLTPFVGNAVTKENIDRSVDYQGWLELKKRKWKNTREERKRHRVSNSNKFHQSDGVFDSSGAMSSHKQVCGQNGVSSLFRRHELALVRSHWQIIQLVPSPEAGHFFAWVVVDGIMLKVPIRVPRVFYLNSKAPITEEFPGKRVNKTLPHGRPIFNLIEVVIDEDQFRAESKKLAAHLADPEVEGIYESKVPVEFNALLQIGCVCKVDRAAKNRNAQDGWSLTELHMKTTTECSYLEQSIPFFYLYHSVSEGRAIYVTYFSASGSVFVVVVNPFQNRELSSTLLEKHFRDACQALSVEPPSSGSGIAFKVEYVGHVRDAEKLLQRTINEYRHHGPTVGVIECPKVHSLKSGISVLNDFPCVSIPCNARDSQYQALGWQIVAAKIGMQRCAASSQWLNERISLSRYAHVPLGNFELDWLLFTADIFFSRALRDQQQVLWISDDGIPDLGGISEDDTCFTDEVHQPVLTYPGAYRKVTVELKIHHLAVNALLKSNQVNEMEGGALFGFDQDINAGPHEQTGFDETRSCASAFRVLKQLIQRCLQDAIKFGNVFADALLQHLYRWLCSPQSKLHDPSLHRVLHKVMQKVFAMLLAELRRLGATIIFADFSKVIIDTGKSDLSAAHAYCDCLLKTLQSRDLFEWIELEAQHFWHSLLFMDQHNYGGILAKADNLNSLDECANGVPEVNIVSSWNIAEYLPSVTRISSYFTERILKIVRDTIHHVNGINKSKNDARAHVPKISSGSNIHLGDAALEFIKNVCAVLSLDQNVQDDILDGQVFPTHGGGKTTKAHQRLINEVMRKILLRFVRVREFDPEVEFSDPCQSFILPNVICRDLDLCRDSALLAQEWHCAVPQCGQPYDCEVMENALFQISRQRERVRKMCPSFAVKCRRAVLERGSKVAQGLISKLVDLQLHLGILYTLRASWKAKVFIEILVNPMSIGWHSDSEVLNLDLKNEEFSLRVGGWKGKPSPCLTLFDEMPERTLISWTVLMSGYTRHGYADETLGVFQNMVECHGNVSLQPDSFVYAIVLRACSVVKNLSYGRELHCRVLKIDGVVDNYVENALVSMYASCGCVWDSVRVFNGIARPDLVSWSSLISGFVENGQEEEGLRLFVEMVQSGIRPDVTVSSMVIGASAKLGSFGAGIQMHCCVVKMGMRSSLFLENTLMNFYVKCRDLNSSVQIFDLMPKRDLVSWNTIITGYVHNQFYHEALRVFQAMMSEDLKCDDFTLTSVLHAVTCLEALKLGREIHGYIIRAGLESDLYVISSLLDMYIEFNYRSLGPMSKVPLKIYNSLEGGSSDEFVIANVLKWCSLQLDLEAGKALHSQIVKHDLLSDSYVISSLIDMYSKCKIPEAAQRIFERVKGKGMVTWAAIIAGYCCNGWFEEALELFQRMQLYSVEVNEYIYTSVLLACLALEDLRKGKEMHCKILRTGYGSNISVVNTLINLYSKLWHPQRALALCSLIPHGEIIWSFLIEACLRIKDHETIFNLLQMIQRSHGKLDSATVCYIFNFCANSCLLNVGTQQQAYLTKRGFVSDIITNNSLIKMYSECGMISDAVSAFRSLPEKNSDSWTAVISANVDHGYPFKAIELFKQMCWRKKLPDSSTLTSILKAYAQMRLVDEAFRLFGSINKLYGIEPSIEHYSCMIEVLGRAGKFKNAQEFIDASIPFDPVPLVWNTLLSASRIHGNMRVAKYAAEKLLDLEKNNLTANVLLEQVLLTEGMWDDASKLKIKYKFSRGNCSWIEIRNNVHVFTSDQILTEDISSKLVEMEIFMEEMGYVADRNHLLHNAEEEGYEGVGLHHTEMKALAFGLLSLPQGMPIRVFKGVRMCGDCHSAFKFLSAFLNRELVVKDFSNFHHFTSGKCSCKDKW